MFEEEIVINMEFFNMVLQFKKTKFEVINFMINFAQFTGYNYHLGNTLNNLQHKNKRLIVELISSLIYLKHSGIKQFNVKEVKKILICCNFQQIFHCSPLINIICVLYMFVNMYNM